MLTALPPPSSSSLQWGWGALGTMDRQTGHSPLQPEPEWVRGRRGLAAALSPRAAGVSPGLSVPAPQRAQDGAGPPLEVWDPGCGRKGHRLTGQARLCLV